jgi:hypothetical protein
LLNDYLIQPPLDSLYRTTILLGQLLVGLLAIKIFIPENIIIKPLPPNKLPITGPTFIALNTLYETIFLNDF